MTLIIGLTGGIGSGKSTVSAFFSELNISVVDADIVARQVVKKGTPALEKIANHFGETIIINGELNRSLLREIIFKDKQQKEWLNNLLHPLIATQIIQLLAQAESDYVLLEAPLLFENQLDRLTDYNLVVDIDTQLQIARACARDAASKENVEAIISSQISREDRLKKADFVIDNTGRSLENLKNSVIELDKQFKTLAKRGN